jgi:hypothetical protein
VPASDLTWPAIVPCAVGGFSPVSMTGRPVAGVRHALQASATATKTIGEKRVIMCHP